MKVTDYIPEGSNNAISRHQLRAMTGLSDREMRNQINKSDELIINLMDGRGYFKPLPEDRMQVEIWKRQCMSRIKDLAKTLRKGEAWTEEQEMLHDLLCPGIEEDEWD